uniref:Uncharacterized protein n=1 Tax=Mycena chlorophos TaxID=658473 RepID=A0ABQ0LVY1_MYCCL|nr:predicted protein [Mycena chlorophos]
MRPNSSSVISRNALNSPFGASRSSRKCSSSSNAQSRSSRIFIAASASARNTKTSFTTRSNSPRTSSITRQTLASVSSRGPWPPSRLPAPQTHSLPSKNGPQCGPAYASLTGHTSCRGRLVFPRPDLIVLKNACRSRPVCQIQRPSVVVRIVNEYRDRFGCPRVVPLVVRQPVRDVAVEPVPGRSSSLHPRRRTRLFPRRILALNAGVWHRHREARLVPSSNQFRNLQQLTQRKHDRRATLPSPFLNSVSALTRHGRMVSSAVACTTSDYTVRNKP